MFAGKTVTLYKDDKKGEPQLVPLKVKENGKVQLEILPQGGAVLVNIFGRVEMVGYWQDWQKC